MKVHGLRSDYDKVGGIVFSAECSTRFGCKARAAMRAGQQSSST
jgi:hypothetical protein